MLQAVQRQVCQNRGNDASLWRSCLRWEKPSRFNKARFQPFLKDALVHADIGNQPVVTDVVKTTFDISFQHPFWGSFPAQYVSHLFDSVCRRALTSESVGMMVASCFSDRLQR